MNDSKKIQLSIVVPIYNEADGLTDFNHSLLSVIKPLTDDSYEIIYCDDGSADNTYSIVRELHQTNQKVKLLRLSRNFGKESALSAGIAASSGSAVLMIDGDGQHPVDLIPKFVEAWKNGSKVVVGIRKTNKDEGWFKKFGSKFFYLFFNKLTTKRLMPGSTDFRLIDQSVRKAFMQMQETNRITRGLIDWVGFKREYIYFHANARKTGEAGYGKGKLINSPTDSVVSLTPTPLYLFGYLGVFITVASFILGASVFIEQIIFNDPWHWKFTGTAMLGILILFLVGIVLTSQGILSLYISHIQNQTKNRPLYIVDDEESIGVKPLN